eukprot:scaffold669159_cov42-Prasinocladus_malaysianus.AAC.1
MSNGKFIDDPCFYMHPSPAGAQDRGMERQAHLVYRDLILLAQHPVQRPEPKLLDVAKLPMPVEILLRILPGESHLLFKSIIKHRIPISIPMGKRHTRSLVRCFFVYFAISIG